MQLNLHAYRQPIAQNPRRELFIAQFGERRRKQNRRKFRQLFFSEQRYRPLVIQFRGNDKFDFIISRQQRQILPAILGDFARAGCFDIDDARYPRIDCGDIDGTAGF